MEVLSRLLNAAADLPGFLFHPRCSKIKLTHLCFADDLLLFAHADSVSLDIYKAILSYFEGLSGLAVNSSKSSVFFANVNQEDKETFLQQLGFQEGTLPITYLGVPLISTRLSPAHCHTLIARISGRISSWTSRFLSFAGRLQLVKSVLYSMQAYWSSMFILPKKVIKSIEQICARFLWTGPEMKKASSKVKWEDISLPHAEGGLGLKKGAEWNIALSAKHLWNVICRSGSLWVAWIWSYRLRNRSIWHIKASHTCSWAWNQLLKIRYHLKPHLSYSIGNGENTLLWYDPWLPHGSICDSLDEEIIQETNSHPSAKVEDVIVDGVWRWPATLSSVQSTIPLSFKPSPWREDKIVWKLSSSGKFTPSSLWQHLRVKNVEVLWHKAIWFNGNIPSHAFILWLTILNRLPTLSRMIKWGIISDSRCPLCNQQEETRDHLFFECTFSRRIWQDVMIRNGVSRSLNSWEEELNTLSSFKGKSLASKVYKISFAAMVYIIWKERNARMHQEDHNSFVGICSSIVWHVKFKVILPHNYHIRGRDVEICNRWGIALDSHNGLSN